MKADIPVNENLRLADLYQYNILDTQLELRLKNQQLERITEAQRRIISIIGLYS